MKTGANFEIRTLLWWITSPCNFSAQLQNRLQPSETVYKFIVISVAYILVSILLLHVFFQFYLSIFLLFQNCMKQSIKKTRKQKLLYWVKGCINSNGKDLLLKLKLFEKFQTHFFQVILKLFLIFLPFWVGHLYRPV